MRIIIFFLCLSLIGCEKKKEENFLNPKIVNKMIKRCMGRLSIELPSEYTPKSAVTASFTPHGDQIDDGFIDVLAQPALDTKEFAQQVARREAELLGEAEVTGNAVQSHKFEGRGKIFRVHIIDDAYKSELHWLLNNVHIVATIKSYKNQVKQAEEMLTDFLHHVVVQDSVNNTKDSFCLGTIAVTGNYRGETASFNFSSDSGAKGAFSVEINTYEKDDPETLHDRLSGKNSLSKFGVKETVIRKSERSVSRMRAQEWLSSIRPGENGADHDLTFLLETMRTIPGPASPKLHLEMDIPNAQASEDQASIRLWDAIVNSVKNRE